MLNNVLTWKLNEHFLNFNQSKEIEKIDRISDLDKHPSDKPTTNSKFIYDRLG